jgi:hypothetical protein
MVRDNGIEPRALELEHGYSILSTRGPDGSTLQFGALACGHRQIAQLAAANQRRQSLIEKVPWLP